MFLIRSAEMQLCEMVLHKETAFNCLVALGYLGKVEFVNAHSKDSELNQNQDHMVERCLRLQNIINRFGNEMNEFGLKMMEHPNVDEDFRPNTTDLSEIENAVVQLHEELDETITSCNEVENLRDTLLEKREVLLRADSFITVANNTELREKNTTTEIRWLNFITGCVPVKNFAAFELMVWRVSRDEVFMNHEEYKLEKKATDSPHSSRYKYTFIIACVTNEIYSKLIKVCNGFGVKLYAFPLLPSEREKLLASYNTEISDLEQIYTLTLEHKRSILEACVTDLQIWHSKINKILAVYTVLTHFDTVLDLEDGSETKYFEATCWIPKMEVDTVRKILIKSAQSDTNGKAEHITFPVIFNEIHNQDQLEPPTLLHTNEFTRGFQNMINTYGYASYRELNPGPVSIITFSFFFAIMLADVGHGLLIVIIALSLMICNSKFMKSKQYQKPEYEILRFLMTERYVILLMGVCSVYTGLIYNRIFSKTMNLFGSNWAVTNSTIEMRRRRLMALDPPKVVKAVTYPVELDPANANNFGGYPYAMGLDPIWGTLAENSIHINNSLKIKVAIIYGIVNLFSGLTMSVFNAVYFGDKVNIFLIILPKFVFICCTFLYLLVLIMFKWFKFGGYQLRDHSPACAPSLFNMALHIFLFMEPKKLDVGCGRYMYENQDNDRFVLTPLAICSVVVLLCGYPIRTIIENAKAQRLHFKVNFMSRVEKTKIFFPQDFHRKRKKVRPFKNQLPDVLLNQVFITFEIVMGSVLHVASFLRMWALSMAHSQMSSFVWHITLQWALKIDYSFLNSIFIFGGFAIFAVITIIYLVIMEGVSIFIQTLRIQFFDFQFLFFKSNGYPFRPFHFKPFNNIEMES